MRITAICSGQTPISHEVFSMCLTETGGGNAQSRLIVVCTDFTSERLAHNNQTSAVCLSLLYPLIPSYHCSHMCSSFITSRHANVMKATHATEGSDDSSIPDRSGTAFWVRVYCFSLLKSMNKRLWCLDDIKCSALGLGSFPPMRIRPPWRYAAAPIAVILSNSIQQVWFDWFTCHSCIKYKIRKV